MDTGGCRSHEFERKQRGDIGGFGGERGRDENNVNIILI